MAGFAGVVLGAFGAHGLRSHLSLERLDIWQTAVLYHLIHALALVGVGLAGQWLNARGVLALSGGAFVLGLLLFSGSLYLLSVTGTRILGAITPLGGVAFLAGWALLFWAAWRG